MFQSILNDVVQFMYFNGFWPSADVVKASIMLRDPGITDGDAAALAVRVLAVA